MEKWTNSWWHTLMKEHPEKAKHLFTIMNIKCITEGDFQEFILVGFTFDELIPFLPAAMDIEDARKIYLKYSTELGNLLYDDRET
jgi:hypothetical protein